MLEHIQTYWVTYACGILASVITGLITYVKTTRTKRKSGDAAERQAILALLHDRLYQSCGYYLRREWASEEDKRNLDYLYEPYPALGGNGTCHTMYEQCLALPLEPNRKEGK